MPNHTAFTSLSSRCLYTIGWISALPLERAAAVAMLDAQHGQPCDFVQSRSDPNSYIWGSIGAHNVVIASLPAGEYGLVSADNIATNLLSSFPEVRLGLMVGIGAGIPRPDTDIRLGDVVISQPRGRTGGVVQYDFIKAIQGGIVQRMGFMNSPPRLLLSAVSALQAQHECQPSEIPQFLAEMITNFPWMARSHGLPGYIYQGSSNDRLFNAAYQHAGGRDCSNCDPTRQVWRPERSSNNPQVHYGLIASGNTLVKDSHTRVSLLRQIGEECICFEMEAAGLMNQFPCLVIRGICDYADSHKNDNWQRYAAATAAAYAKELLKYVPRQDVGETQKALDTMRQDNYYSPIKLPVNKREVLEYSARQDGKGLQDPGASFAFHRSDFWPI